MEHKDQHHAHLQEEIRRHKEHHHKDGSLRVIHPHWFLVLGCVLVLLSVAVWVLIVP
ncbi:MAG: hypothetical protein U0736_03450 [Gemmataceae bacterium]